MPKPAGRRHFRCDSPGRRGRGAGLHRTWRASFRGCALLDGRKYPAIPHIGFQALLCGRHATLHFEPARSWSTCGSRRYLLGRAWLATSRRVCSCRSRANSRTRWSIWRSKSAATDFASSAATIDTGPEIRWRRDYLRGIETGLDYFRRIPYLDTARAGDHKIVWELNRHQHLVILAEAYSLTGDSRNLDEICAQLESWMAENPFHHGTNWASALEVAFRALSWIWIDRLVGRSMPARFRARWLHMLYLHGCHLANNLSFYFSPNNHLVGEGAGFARAWAVFCGTSPDAAAGNNWASRVMREQMERQIRAGRQQLRAVDVLSGLFIRHVFIARSSGQPGPRVSRQAGTDGGVFTRDFRAVGPLAAAGGR